MSGSPPDARGAVGLHVLLVEDDELLRTQTYRRLASLGCEVTDCREALGALAQLEEGAFDLLLTDLRLGAGMGGEALAQEARRRSPALAVVLTSGAPPEHQRCGATMVFLQKPYRAAALAGAIDEAVRLASADSHVA